MQMPQASPVPIFWNEVNLNVLTFALLGSSKSVLVETAVGKRAKEGDPANLFTCTFDFMGALLDPDLLGRSVTKWVEEWPSEKEAIAQKLADAKKTEEEQRHETRKRKLKECRPSEYLRQTIFPSLATGLLQLERDRPEDPLAFLAIHLLQSAERESK